VTRFLLALSAALLAGAAAQAGPFNKGIGDAMYYGPYTGGHGYSPNVAYSYGLSFRAADSWRVDPFAYPVGVDPYPPHYQPKNYRGWWKPYEPYPTEPGEPHGPVVVIQPGIEFYNTAATPLTTTPAAAPVNGATTGLVKVNVPADAVVWIEKQQMKQTGTDRVYETPDLPPGKTAIYSIRAKWTKDGKPVERYRVLGIKAGETAKINFLLEKPF